MQLFKFAFFPTYIAVTIANSYWYLTMCQPLLNHLYEFSFDLTAMALSMYIYCEGKGTEFQRGEITDIPLFCNFKDFYN